MTLLQRIPSFRSDPHIHARVRLDHTAAPLTANLATAGTFYTLSSNIVDGNSEGFTLDESGRLTLTNPGDNQHIDVIGTANLSVDVPLFSDPVRITFALFVNGVQKLDITTPLDFNGLNQVAELAVAGSLQLDEGDYLETKASSSEDDTDVTIEFFSVIYKGA
jgi:hypothetical protein